MALPAKNGFLRCRSGLTVYLAVIEAAIFQGILNLPQNSTKTVFVVSRVRPCGEKLA